MISTNRLKDCYHKLISINSVTGNEKEIADYIEKRLLKMGLDVKKIYFDKEKLRPVIYTRLKGTFPGKRMLLIGHIDTVKVTKGWETDPFTPIEIDDKTFGLGSMDMKGGVSAILETMEYFSKNHQQFCGEIIAAFVPDEENLSQGTFRLIEEDDLEADMAIMAECRYDNVAVGFRGRYTIEIDIMGKSAHSSKYPKYGENALVYGSKLALAIEKLPTLKHPKLGVGSWCVKSIEGGIKDSVIVPDTCKILVDRYFVIGEDFEFFKKQIYDEAEKIGIKDKVSIKLRDRKLPYMEPFCIDEHSPLVTTLKKKFFEIAGSELSHEYDLSICDSNILFNHKNIPTITFGPSGGNMHAPNEYGYFNQVINSTNIYIETIKELLCD